MGGIVVTRRWLLRADPRSEERRLPRDASALTVLRLLSASAPCADMGAFQSVGDSGEAFWVLEDSSTWCMILRVTHVVLVFGFLDLNLVVFVFKNLAAVKCVFLTMVKCMFFLGVLYVIKKIH